MQCKIKNKFSYLYLSLKSSPSSPSSPTHTQLAGGTSALIVLMGGSAEGVNNFSPLAELSDGTAWGLRQEVLGQGFGFGKV